MSNIMEYKGYHAKIEYSDEDNIFIGKILGINDVLAFEGETISQLKEMFHDNIDDYLAMCEEIGKRYFMSNNKNPLTEDKYKYTTIVNKSFGNKLQEITTLIAIENDILKLQNMCLRVALQGENVLFIKDNIYKIFPSTYKPKHGEYSIWDWCQENNILVSGSNNCYNFYWGNRY